LGERTGDRKLRGQIAEFLEKAERDFRAFRQNDSHRYIYTLEVVGEGWVSPGIRNYTKGYFFDWELARSYGKKMKRSFAVKKQLIATEPGLIRKDVGFSNPHFFPNRPVEECILEQEWDYMGSPVGILDFSQEGETVRFERNEIPLSDKDKQRKLEKLSTDN